MPGCVFCRNFPPVIENELAYVLFDIAPVSQGHALVIPRRHVEQVFDVTSEEWAAMHELIVLMRGRLEKEHAPDGYNIWMNSGKAAGQVVMHAHLHLIPRYQGQMIRIKDHLKDCFS